MNKQQLKKKNKMYLISTRVKRKRTRKRRKMNQLPHKRCKKKTLPKAK